MVEILKKIGYLIAVFACCLLGGNLGNLQTSKQGEKEDAVQILGRLCGLAAADGISDSKRLMALDLCEKFDKMTDKDAAKLSEVLDAIP